MEDMETKNLNPDNIEVDLTFIEESGEEIQDTVNTDSIDELIGEGAEIVDETKTE